MLVRIDTYSGPMGGRFVCNGCVGDTPALALHHGYDGTSDFDRVSITAAAAVALATEL